MLNVGAGIEVENVNIASQVTSRLPSTVCLSLNNRTLPFIGLVGAPIVVFGAVKERSKTVAEEASGVKLEEATNSTVPNAVIWACLTIALKMSGGIPNRFGNEYLESFFGMGKVERAINTKVLKYLKKNYFYVMNAPSCIQNNILVELDKAFQDEMISSGGLLFYKDTTFRPEWNTTIMGKVASVPLAVTIGGGAMSIDPDRPRIRPIVKPGDEIVFSYLVIMNRRQTDNVAEIFVRETPTNAYTTVWSNPMGLQIVRVYLKNDKWEIGLFDTKSRTWVDRVKGGKSEVEGFMGKYMPTENVGFNYGNLLPVGEKDYWMVDYANAFAIKRAEGVFDMIGDYALIEPMREPIRDTYQGIIELYNVEQSTDYKATGKLLSIGEPLKGDKKLSVKPNDIICTDIRYVQKYEIDGRDYWIVRQKHILGKSVTNEHIADT